MIDGFLMVRIELVDKNGQVHVIEAENPKVVEMDEIAGVGRVPIPGTFGRFEVEHNGERSISLQVRWTDLTKASKYRVRGGA